MWYGENRLVGSPTLPKDCASPKYKEINSRSISFVQTCDNKSTHLLFDIFRAFYSIRALSYLQMECTHIVFLYSFASPKVVKNKFNKPLNLKGSTQEGGSNKDEGKINITKLDGFNLPNTIDFTLWGEVIN